MTTLLDALTLRPMRAGDLNFIRSSWLKSYERSVRGTVPSSSYFELHWEVVRGLLERPSVRVVVASERAAEDHLVGWACAEPGAPPPHTRRALAHYTYVKSAFRGA